MVFLRYRGAFQFQLSLPMGNITQRLRTIKTIEICVFDLKKKISEPKGISSDQRI